MDYRDLGDKRLVERIRARILKVGRITFAEFMEMALYDPEGGYYTSKREPVGTDGDYITSPAIHPAFGAMVARWLADRWREMGCPDPFNVVEMGAGKGLLRTGVAAYLREFLPDVHAVMRYVVVEKRRSIHDPNSVADHITVCESLDQIPDSSVVGCFLSNELVDAFPVHIVTVENGKLREIYVSSEDEGFVEEIGEPSTPEIPAYFEGMGISLPEGYRTEVNLRALEWIREVGAKLREGFVLTIDYGYTADQYYSPDHRRGTLMCYYRHTYSEDPYIRIGRQDITAHVDFTSLMETGRAAGFEPVSLVTQREFLLEQGIEEWLCNPAMTPSGRRAILGLLDPHGMGKFKVLAQRKQRAPVQRLSG